MLLQIQLFVLLSTLASTLSSVMNEQLLSLVR